LVQFVQLACDGKFAGVAGITRPFSVAIKSIKELALEHEMNYLFLTDKHVFVAAYAGDPSASDQTRATFEGLSGKPLQKTEWATPWKILPAPPPMWRSDCP
jgi:hypothetical protein